MAHADDARKITTDQLTLIAKGKSDMSDWGTEEAREAASAELSRRGLGPDPISADAKYIARATDDNSGRIIKHLWIIFVLLPVVLGIIFEILK
jgi:hypothetical protein